MRDKEELKRFIKEIKKDEIDNYIEILEYLRSDWIVNQILFVIDDIIISLKRRIL